MTPQRLCDIIDSTGMKEAWLIQMLNVDDRRFRRWKIGARPIPNAAGTWLESLARHLRENPPPNLHGVPRDA